MLRSSWGSRFPSSTTTTQKSTTQQTAVQPQQTQPVQTQPSTITQQNATQASLWGGRVTMDQNKPPPPPTNPAPAPQQQPQGGWAGAQQYSQNQPAQVAPPQAVQSPYETTSDAARNGIQKVGEAAPNGFWQGNDGRWYSPQGWALQDSYYMGQGGQMYADPNHDDFYNPANGPQGQIPLTNAHPGFQNQPQQPYPMPSFAPQTPQPSGPSPNGWAQRGMAHQPQPQPQPQQQMKNRFRWGAGQRPVGLNARQAVQPQQQPQPQMGVGFWQAPYGGQNRPAPIRQQGGGSGPRMLPGHQPPAQLPNPRPAGPALGQVDPQLLGLPNSPEFMRAEQELMGQLSQTLLELGIARDQIPAAIAQYKSRFETDTGLRERATTQAMADRGLMGSSVASRAEWEAEIPEARQWRDYLTGMEGEYDRLSQQELAAHAAYRRQMEELLYGHAQGLYESPPSSVYAGNVDHYDPGGGSQPLYWGAAPGGVVQAGQFKPPSAPRALVKPQAKKGKGSRRRGKGK